MKKYYAKSAQDPQNKKRPSIQFSPTLQQPIYIITKNLNGPHIIQLVDQLDKHKIPYQMQQETETLGFKLNHRFFVIVDNKYGEVSLGPQFGSIMMTVVGYPRLGRNQRNRYFEKPSEIIKFHEIFKENRDISEKQKSLINKQCADTIIEKTESNSKLKSKIMIKSISKYKSLEKDSTLKNSLISQNKCSAKLYVIQDKSSAIYSKLCNELTSLIKKEAIQKLGSVDEMKKRAIIPTNKVNVFYLVNQTYERQLLDNIFIGEAIVFNSEIAAHNLKSAFTESKIYGITSERADIIKMLQSIGLLPRQDSQVVVSKLPENSQVCSEQPQAKQVKQVQSQQPQKKFKAKQLLAVPQVSKIEGVQSVISENNKQTNLKQSKASSSSAKSLKVKRIKRSKPKNDQAVIIQNQYFAGNKEVLSPKLLKDQKETCINRKIVLKSQQKQNIIKSKKSLKFVDAPEQQIKIKKIKSISKFQPKQIQVTVQNSSTLTQNEYFSQRLKSSKPFSVHVQNRNSGQSSSKPSISTECAKDTKGINAVFYRQFIHTFLQTTELIKRSPSSLFSQPSKYQFYQPFFNMTEFDRSAKRIKRKLKEAGHSCDQFRFLVFLLEEQVPAFEKYCFEKNKYYDQQGYEMESMMKASSFSSTFTTKKVPKLTIYLFIESSSKIDQKILNYGHINVLKFGFPTAVERGQSLEAIKQKITESERSLSQNGNWQRLDKVYQN